MQRLIKFRAWGKFESYDKENTMFELPFGKDMYWYEEGCINKFPKDWVIMQYTGLHDSKNREIFEGDIVQDNDGSIGEVIFEEERALWVIKCPPNQLSGHLYEIYFWHKREVIGNIYETPELLEKVNV